MMPPAVPGVVLLSAAELAAVVREAVSTALGEHEHAKLDDHLLDRQGLARFLDCSLRHVDGLIAEGMPFVRIGLEAKRFDRAEVIAWLRSRG